MKHNYLKQLFTALLLLCTTIASAYDFEVSGIYYNILVDKTNEVEVTWRGPNRNSYDEYTSSVTIPATVSYNGTTYSVTSIGSSAFYSCTSLTSITIPKSVTSIGDYAFEDCSSLISVTIGESVASIGKSAFTNCSGLTSITILNSVKIIGDYAFYNCSGLTSVTIGNSVTSIGNSAFTNCSGLTSITIPNSVKTIGDGAFSNCEGLTSITIPNNVTSIGNYAFSGCSGLTSVVWNAHYLQYFYYANDAPFYDIRSQITSFTFGDNVQKIPGQLCREMRRLTSITIPNSVTSIGDDAFKGCSGLTTVTIGNSVKSIGERAFESCSSLTSITIPNSVTTIGGGVFDYCKSLSSVTIGSGVTSIGERAFESCSSLTSVVWNAKRSDYFSKGYDSPLYDVSSQITSFTIGESVEYVPSCICYNMSSLTSVVWNAKRCHDFSNSPFADIRSQITNITFGASVEWIPASLCRNLSNLTSITIPNSVTSIGDNAFIGCSGLTSVTIPNSVTSIGSSAFYGCSSLISITIPNSVTTIGDRAFDNTGIYNNESNWENKVLYIDNCLIGAKTSISGSYTIKDDCRLIADWVFYGCKGLTSITIPNNVTSIGYDAFSDCSSLISVTIGESVTRIGTWAFALCESLKEFICYADEIPEMGENVFQRTPQSTATLYVPTKVLDDYKAAKQWKDFGTILPLETAIENTHSQSPMTNCQKLLRKGQLIIIRDGVEYNAVGQEM